MRIMEYNLPKFCVVSSTVDIIVKIGNIYEFKNLISVYGKSIYKLRQSKDDVNGMVKFGSGPEYKGVKFKDFLNKHNFDVGMLYKLV